MNDKSPDVDRFAAIATSVSPELRGGMCEPDSPPHSSRTLPLEAGGTYPLGQVVGRIGCAEELKQALSDLRRRMSVFEQDLAPALSSSREVLCIDWFDWRIEGPEDRSGFSEVLQGEGGWEKVTIPHYGPPLGPASTLYRREFEMPEEMITRERQFICFEAVDYRCQIYLNGVCLGVHEGIFDPFEFDITSVVKRSDNVLLVRVENDFTMLGQAFSDGDADGDKVYAATGLGYDDPIEGWHHCPPGMGIWQGVRIEGRARLSISDLFVRPLASLDEVEILIEVLNSGGNPEEEASLSISIYGQNFESVVVERHSHTGCGKWVRGFGDLDHGTPETAKSRMGRGINYLSVTLPIPSARKWEPSSPWLYQVQVSLQGVAGLPMDACQRQFGMRRFVQDESSEPKGRFLLNGREIRLRGANTMGNLDLCVFRGDHDQLRDDILLAKLTHMNFLRLTQHPVQRGVYEACDRLGMMLQTDLPLFGSIRRNQFLECVRQSAAMERLVRCHPSSILVSFINEPFPAARAKPHRFMERDDMEVFFDVASKAVLRENPDRVIKCVDGDYDPPVKEGMQDNHCYCGWYIGHGVDLGRLLNGQWMPVKRGWHFGCGEFGSEGLDSLAVMQEFYPCEWLDGSEEGAWSPAAIPKAQSMNFHYLWYPSPSSIEEWIDGSQAHQEWVTRLMTEAFRRMSGMNTFAIHLFIDAWPAGWMKTLMDVKRIPKKAWFAYRDALSPLAVSQVCNRTAGFEGETLSVEIWIANDLDEVPQGLKLDYSILEGDRVLSGGRSDAVVERCTPSSQGWLEVLLPSTNCRTLVTSVVTLLDESGAAIHDSRCAFLVFPKVVRARTKVTVLGEDPDAMEMVRSLGFEPTGGEIVPGRSILIVDHASYLALSDQVDAAVKQGSVAVFLSLKEGVRRIGGHGVSVGRAGMGSRHFVSCDSVHPLVQGFEREDFKFWHDERFGHPSPILHTVLEADGWTPILLSGDGGWARPWGSVPVAVEMEEGLGCWRICQVDLLSRVRTNPAATEFAQRFLSIHHHDRVTPERSGQAQNSEPCSSSVVDVERFRGLAQGAKAMAPG